MALERTLAPDVTESPAGRELVVTMADGIEKLMLAQGIPFTDDGFERVVELSRENGMMGLIGYADPADAERLRALLRGAFGPLADNLLPDIANPARGSQVRKRLAGIGVTVDAEGTLSSDGERFFDGIVARFGENARSMLLPFVHGDCQRRLVFDELRRRHPGGGAEHT